MVQKYRHAVISIPTARTLFHHRQQNTKHETKKRKQEKKIQKIYQLLLHDCRKETTFQNLVLTIFYTKK